jgi:hypothetical protein
MPKAIKKIHLKSGIQTQKTIKWSFDCDIAPKSIIFHEILGLDLKKMLIKFE